MELDLQLQLLVATYDCPATLRAHALCNSSFRHLILRVEAADLFLNVQTDNVRTQKEVLRRLRNVPSTILEVYASTLLWCLRTKASHIRGRSVELILRFDDTGAKYWHRLVKVAEELLAYKRYHGFRFAIIMDFTLDKLHGQEKFIMAAAIHADDWMFAISYCGRCTSLD